MTVYAVVVASYFLVAILGIVLGRIWAELEHQEATAWPTVPEVDWSATDPYDWDQEGALL